MNLFESLAKLITLSAKVIYKEKLSENIYHLKIQGDALKNANYVPGYHLRIMVGLGKETSFRDKIRTYSIWKFDQNSGIIDLAVCNHSNGPGAQWVQDVQPGESIHFSKPKGKFTLDTSGDYYLFIGDLSALGHLYEIRRHLKPHQKVMSFIYSAHENDFFADIDNLKIFDFHPVEYPQIDPIKQSISEFVSQQTGKGIVYLGGDGRVCVELNTYFKKKLNWSSSQIKTKPFWHPDKKGLE